MKKKLLFLFSIGSLIGYSNTGVVPVPTSTPLNTKTMVPYLQKNGLYRYVNSKTMETAISKEFYGSSLFTSTGYAVVTNAKHQDAVIDIKGDFVKEFSDYSTELDVFDNLTLIKEKLEYDKEMPFWKWEFNILGSTKKTKTYIDTKISVLETGQVLTKNEVEYGSIYFNISISKVDDTHFVMNNNLYEVKNKKIKLQKKNVYHLQDQLLLQESGKNVLLMDLHKPQKDIVSLQPLYDFSITVAGQVIALDAVNSRNNNAIGSTLLFDKNKNQTLVYPNFDKPFPKVIKQATPEQVKFIKEISQMSSVYNTPYFILSKFNYDTWNFDYMYLDSDGTILPSITAPDYFIISQVRDVLWPEAKDIIPESFVEKPFKIKIRKCYDDDNLFFIRFYNGDCKEKEGFWNYSKQSWQVQPDFKEIQVLDAAKQIYAVKDLEQKQYYLYNGDTKQRISDKLYDSINSNGMASVKLPDGKQLYFYIDIYTAKEFRE